MNTLPQLRVLTVASLATLAIAACSTGTASPTAGTATPSAAGGGGTTVQVDLQEWSVLPGSASAAAGSVTFQVTNKGPEDVHEFVILRTDLDPGALPTDATGAVSEEGGGIEVVDEIEDIAVGATAELTVPLASGKYVLLCNIYDEAEQEAHFKLGMRTSFSVTQ